MSLYGWLKTSGPNGFGYNATAEEVSKDCSLDGKVCLVTGCNSGLGLETIRVLKLRGAKIIGLAREQSKAVNAMTAINIEGKALECDLSSPGSIDACIRELSKYYPKIDRLICNAGIMALQNLELVQGYEKQFFVNHLGHFRLVTGLMDRLSRDARVICTSSRAHFNAPRAGIQFDNLDCSRGYHSWANYGQSKLANILFTRALPQHLPESRQSAYTLHPGVIQTPLWRHMNKAVSTVSKAMTPLFLKTSAQGAATQTYLASQSHISSPSGTYFVDCNPDETSQLAQDKGLAEKLWEHSEMIQAKLS